MVSENPKPPRLLFIEDNMDTRRIYKDVFEREGFRVVVAEDGEKGLSYAQAGLPDVILLDLMLPKISGFELIKRLRAQPETRQTPIMIFSARDASVDVTQDSDSGFTEYAAKAINSPKQMVQRVRALMQRQQSAAGSPKADVCPTCRRAF